VTTHVPVGTSLIDIAVSHRDPETAAALANSVADQLRKYEAESSTQIPALKVSLSVVDPAVPPRTPEGLGLPLRTALGGAFGLLLSISLAFLIENLGRGIQGVGRGMTGGRAPIQPTYDAGSPEQRPMARPSSPPGPPASGAPRGYDGLVTPAQARPIAGAGAPAVPTLRPAATPTLRPTSSVALTAPSDPTAGSWPSAPQSGASHAANPSLAAVTPPAVMIAASRPGIIGPRPAGATPASGPPPNDASKGTAAAADGPVAAQSATTSGATDGKATKRPRVRKPKGSAQARPLSD
jgi:hypothetical protein